jgi:hypothetical protein
VTRRHAPLPEPEHGWDRPWPNLFELAGALPTDRWTLVGGLMVQAHALAHGITVIRPTDDLYVLLHIEVLTGVATDTDVALTELGYHLLEPMQRKGPAYRYLRGPERGGDKIDVMVADHAAPSRAQRLPGGAPMLKVDGGTQALRRTMIYDIHTGNGIISISVPDELGALVLKSAAHRSDSRDRDRHLADAAALAACISDHRTERARLTGSDPDRLRHLADELADPTHAGWLALPVELRRAGQDTLRILTS